MPDFHAAADAIPALPGAYVLAIILDAPMAGLPAGRYLYCGSARGPGGLRARLGRHMRKGKAVRWHVDRLTEAGWVLGAWVFPDQSECDLVAQLARLPVPLPGFGSSDCRVCPSHLLAWPAGVALPWEDKP
ncbi:MAG: GIY-YIG nuclease family protein [Magnetospirillum sp.]|nr:GIY-YIG nuclease family protein [Magnetospirillum sp.]